MSQPKTPVSEPCVPVYKTFAQSPTIEKDAKSAPATDSAAADLQHPEASTADLRSPGDCFHAEAYLIGWLVRLYGWRVIEPGVLRRSWQPKTSRGAL